MSKIYLLLSLSFSIILNCSGLQNPFDSKSSNYVSDSTLVHILHDYDSTFMDTSVVFDTIVHVDTIVRDSFHIINKIHYDTTNILDTLIDTIHHRDTTVFIDTVIHYDSIGFIDTLHIRDTLHFMDTLYHYDTIVHIDTTHFKDTVHIRDTIHFYDTITHYDTLIHRDTSTSIDTIHFRDTINFRDTLYHYDTLIHRDTVIDTIRFYRTQPFIYLVNFSDSSIFNTFNYGSSYNLAIKAAGIDPKIIRSYSFMPGGGTFWSDVTNPWTRTFSTTSPVVYTLRITTDSGSFANPYTLLCSSSSAIKYSSPVFYSVKVSASSFEKNFYSYVPVCTLWTDSTPFTEYPDRIGLLDCIVDFRFSSGKNFDFYTSKNGSYDTTKDCEFHSGYSNHEIEIQCDDIYPGVKTLTAMCRAVSPDTSLWSSWVSMVFIVRDGR